jgi:hypothetical protein
MLSSISLFGSRTSETRIQTTQDDCIEAIYEALLCSSTKIYFVAEGSPGWRSAMYDQDWLPDAAIQLELKASLVASYVAAT